jgi:hypothetical protein
MELLEEHHQFPGEYMFKIIGFAGEGFGSEVSAAAARVLGQESVEASFRPSRRGRYLAVTLETRVESAQQVLEVYAELRRVEGVVMLV